MIRFLVDEDLPRSLAGELRRLGFDVEDVRDVGLKSRSDEEVHEYARIHGRVLLSGDLGFANILRFPLGAGAGIVVARFPNEMPNRSLNAAIGEALRSLSESDLAGNLVIVEPARIRIRRKTQEAR